MRIMSLNEFRWRFRWIKELKTIFQIYYINCNSSLTIRYLHQTILIHKIIYQMIANLILFQFLYEFGLPQMRFSIFTILFDARNENSAIVWISIPHFTRTLCDLFLAFIFVGMKHITCRSFVVCDFES